MAGRPQIYEYLDERFDKVYEKIEEINKHGIAMDKRLQHIEDRPTPSEHCLEYINREYGDIESKCKAMHDDLNAIAKAHREEINDIKVEMSSKMSYKWYWYITGGLLSLLSATWYFAVNYYNGSKQ